MFHHWWVLSVCSALRVPARSGRLNGTVSTQITSYGRKQESLPFPNRPIGFSCYSLIYSIFIAIFRTRLPIPVSTFANIEGLLEGFW